jgi:hypothetical protein
MKVTPMAHLTANRNPLASLLQCALVGLAAATVLAPAKLNAADPDKSQAAKSVEVTLESISGSSAKRVILSSKAAQRLGIETGKVAEQSIVRKQMVSGLIGLPMDKQPEQKPGGGTFGGFGAAAASPPPATPPVAAPATAPAKPEVKPASLGKMAVAAPGAYAGAQSIPTTATSPQAIPSLIPVAGTSAGLAAPPAGPPLARTNMPIAGDAWVQVTLSPGEWDRLTKDKPARLLALSTRDTFGNEIFARPSGMAPVEDAKRSMWTVYYVVPGGDHGLTLNSRVRVELQHSGNEEQHKVVPYSSVYYDGKGVPWVYVNTKPLTFERQRIGVDRVVGDLAVLSEGPPVGTPIVTVGASLLFGAEIFGK